MTLDTIICVKKSQKKCKKVIKRRRICHAEIEKSEKIDPKSCGICLVSDRFRAK